MLLRRFTLSILLIAVASSMPAFGLDRAHYAELRRQFNEKAKQNDWQGGRAVLAEMEKELPGPTPRFFLTVATVEMKLGHKTEALEWLQKYSATGLSYDFSQDAELKPLADEAKGKRIAAEMKERAKPVSHAELVCELPQADTMPEDIAYVKSNGSFVVSSIQHHTLYRVTPKAGQKTCNFEEIKLEDAAKRWPTMAVSADPKRNALWMTTSAMAGFSGVTKEDEGKAALLEIDLKTGKVLHRFAPEGPGPMALGDMLLAPDGTVYVTASMGGGVYRLRGDLQTAKLEKIADGLFSPQTPVLARDGKRLFVSDYSTGIVVIDLDRPNPEGKLNYLPHPENVAVVAIDGCYSDGNSLVAIQNDGEPLRVIRLQLDRAQTKINGAEIIEQSTDHLGDPTHAVPVNGWFYMLGNVGWAKVDDKNGKLREGESFTPPVIMRFRRQASATGTISK